MASRAAPLPGTAAELEPHVEGLGPPGYAGHRPREMHPTKRMSGERGPAVPGCEPRPKTEH